MEACVVVYILDAMPDLRLMGLERIHFVSGGKLVSHLAVEKLEQFISSPCRYMFILGKRQTRVLPEFHFAPKLTLIQSKTHRIVAASQYLQQLVALLDGKAAPNCQHSTILCFPSASDRRH